MGTKLEDLPQDFLDEFENYSREDLLVRLYRNSEHYNRLANQLVEAQISSSSSEVMLNELSAELRTVETIVDLQEEVLDVLADFIDNWMSQDFPPGSRQRSVQIAIEELVDRVQSTQAYVHLGSMDWEDIDDDEGPWSERQQAEREFFAGWDSDESIHALQDEESY